jgi:hypothetical protein
LNGSNAGADSSTLTTGKFSPDSTGVVAILVAVIVWFMYDVFAVEAALFAAVG